MHRQRPVARMHLPLTLVKTSWSWGNDPPVLCSAALTREQSLYATVLFDGEVARGRKPVSNGLHEYGYVQGNQWRAPASRLTCPGCVQRIQAYDKATSLNTYRIMSPDLAQVAAQMDTQLMAVSPHHTPPRTHVTLMAHIIAAAEGLKLSYVGGGHEDGS